MTDNHNLKTPTEGTTNWDVPLNENFTALDTGVEVRDAETALNEYVPKHGAKFLAADTGAVYLGDGSQWIRTGDVRSLAGDIYVRDSEPVDPSSRDVWLDTSSQVLSYYDGSQWTAVEAGRSTSTTVVEDGESDLSAYDGETSYFDTTANAIAGSGSVRATGAEHGSYRTTVSTSGLPVYPKQGDMFECQVAVDTYSTYGSVLWGVQSTSQPFPCYRLILDTGASPGVRFEKVPVGGSIESHNLSSSNRLSGGAYHDDSAYKPTEGEVYTVRVDWQSDGTMPWSVTDSSGSVLAADSSPTADSEYTGGGIGFMSSRSWTDQPDAVARFDGYRIV